MSWDFNFEDQAADWMSFVKLFTASWTSSSVLV